LQATFTSSLKAGPAEILPHRKLLSVHQQFLSTITCSLNAASAKGPTSSLRRFQPKSPPLRAASSEYACDTWETTPQHKAACVVLRLTTLCRYHWCAQQQQSKGHKVRRTYALLVAEVVRTTVHVALLQLGLLGLLLLLLLKRNKVK
jgi:hypothetical protein